MPTKLIFALLAVLLLVTLPSFAGLLDLIRFRRRFSYAAEVLIRRSNSAGLI